MFRPRLLPWVLAFSAAFVLVVASTATRADGADRDGDGVPDNIEFATQRNVVFAPDFNNGQPHSFSISSRSVGASPDDLFRVSYEAGQFNLEYVRNFANGVVTDEYSLEFRGIIEWVDQNGDGQLQTDEIVGYTPLSELAFENSTVIQTNYTNADGGRVDTFTIRSNDASIALVLTIAQRFMRLSEDRVLTPMEVALDLSIDHTFANPAEFQGARLGLDLRLSTEGTMSSTADSWDSKNGFSKDESGVEVTAVLNSDKSSAFFSWSDEANVDGIPGDVKVTAVEVTEPGSPENEYDLYIAYPAGPNPARVSIVHDPTLGVVSRAYEDVVNAINSQKQPIQSDLTLYGVSLAAMAALVVGTVVLARRWRRREDSGRNS